MKFLAILRAIGQLIVFGKKVQTNCDEMEAEAQELIDPCNCGNRDVQLKKDYDGYWFIWCSSCHIRSTGYCHERSATRAWNADMRKERW